MPVPRADWLAEVVLWWAAHKVAIRPPGTSSAKGEDHLSQGLLVQLLQGRWHEEAPHGQPGLSTAWTSPPALSSNQRPVSLLKNCALGCQGSHLSHLPPQKSTQSHTQLIKKWVSLTSFFLWEVLLTKCCIYLSCPSPDRELSSVF